MVRVLMQKSSSMVPRRIFTSLAGSDLLRSPVPREISGRIPIAARFWGQNQLKYHQESFNFSLMASACRTEDARRPPTVPLPPNTADKSSERPGTTRPDAAVSAASTPFGHHAPITRIGRHYNLDNIDQADLLRGLEAGLGSSFNLEPFLPPPNPLIIVISGPSGVGKDAVIKRLREVRKNIHFVVTATSRAKRPGEVDGKDYYFVTKDQFLSMVERNELLEYALVYGDYKGIPKQQIRDFMSKGFDIVLRVDIQGAATLRTILRNSAIFIFLTAESEAALVKRLVDRKTETTEALLVRIATAREEVKHLREFDYVVVNAEGELESAVKLVESIVDAEKARVRQRRAEI